MENKKSIICADGGTISYSVAGKGQLVLMIHGAAVDSSFFEKAAGILSENCTAIRYDRRGYSESSGNISGSFWEISANDAAAIIKKESPDEKVTVIGHSAGAFIAIKLAGMYPDLIKQMILYEPPIASFLPEEDEYRQIIQRAKSFIKEKKYGRAANKFRLLVCDDACSEQKSEETLLKQEENIKYFIENEFLYVFDEEDIPLEKPAVSTVLCAGKDLKNNCFYMAAKKLSEEWQVPFEEFCGAHNAPSEYPEEFVDGIKRIMDKYESI